MKRLTLPVSLQEKFEGLTTQRKILLFAGTLLALSAAFYFSTYKPLAERINGLKTNIVRQEKRLVELKKARERVDVLEEEVAQSEVELAHLLAMLPDQKEIPGLLDSVSQLGAQVGLENILFQPQPEQPREFYAVIPVRLDLIGSYHELGTFFDRISKLNRILKVDNLTITRRDDSTLQVGCTIVTYRFLEPAQQQTEGKKKRK
ncbi:type 4a pilus biogenesis protein PilO [Desulfoferrobacter suflitae]|uniref:type 4a pilus biogenesis protein PilO n=1 Tax=Desulfoferrobacter suflitae TaxID=2865782 RepID=UPI002164C95C|nr:type 4a pilus biogenesis protein PilO [Desulfoferrobacter suflitae]MCK8603999.1 type 4a pilus biogenesis protein PilO [Desulfoferrobacter suflitae]